MTALSSSVSEATTTDDTPTNNTASADSSIQYSSLRSRKGLRNVGNVSKNVKEVKSTRHAKNATKTKNAKKTKYTKTKKDINSDIHDKSSETVGEENGITIETKSLSKTNSRTNKKSNNDNNDTDDQNHDTISSQLDSHPVSNSSEPLSLPSSLSLSQTSPVPTSPTPLSSASSPIPIPPPVLDLPVVNHNDISHNMNNDMGFSDYFAKPLSSSSLSSLSSSDPDNEEDDEEENDDVDNIENDDHFLQKDITKPVTMDKEVDENVIDTKSGNTNNDDIKNTNGKNNDIDDLLDLQETSTSELSDLDSDAETERLDEPELQELDRLEAEHRQNVMNLGRVMKLERVPDSVISSPTHEVEDNENNEYNNNGDEADNDHIDQGVKDGQDSSEKETTAAVEQTIGEADDVVAAVTSHEGQEGDDDQTLLDDSSSLSSSLSSPSTSSPISGQEIEFPEVDNISSNTSLGISSNASSNTTLTKKRQRSVSHEDLSKELKNSKKLKEAEISDNNESESLSVSSQQADESGLLVKNSDNDSNSNELPTTDNQSLEKDAQSPTTDEVLPNSFPLPNINELLSEKNENIKNEMPKNFIEKESQNITNNNNISNEQEESKEKQKLELPAENDIQTTDEEKTITGIEDADDAKDPALAEDSDKHQLNNSEKVTINGTNDTSDKGNETVKKDQEMLEAEEATETTQKTTSEPAEEQLLAAQQAERKAALSLLTNIEIEFAKLRDQLHYNKMAQFVAEIEMCAEGTHPDLEKACIEIQSVRNERVKQAELRRKYQRICTDIQTRANRAHLHQQFMKDRAEIRAHLLLNTTEEWYKINRERRLMDTLVPEYGFRPSTDPAVQSREYKAYNDEVLLLSKINIRHGFPAAPAMRPSTQEEIEEDFRLLSKGNIQNIEPLSYKSSNGGNGSLIPGIPPTTYASSNSITTTAAAPVNSRANDVGLNGFMSTTGLMPQAGQQHEQIYQSNPAFDTFQKNKNHPQQNVNHNQHLVHQHHYHSHH